MEHRNFLLDSSLFHLPVNCDFASQPETFCFVFFFWPEFGSSLEKGFLFMSFCFSISCLFAGKIWGDEGNWKCELVPLLFRAWEKDTSLNWTYLQPFDSLKLMLNFFSRYLGNENESMIFFFLFGHLWKFDLGWKINDRVYLNRCTPDKQTRNVCCNKRYAFFSPKKEFL